MTRRTEGPRVETWRQHPADPPQSRTDAEESARRGGGDSGGGKVETEWRQQALSIPFLPSRFPAVRPAPPHPVAAADRRMAGPLLAVPRLASAIRGAMGFPARTAGRAAAVAWAPAVLVAAEPLPGSPAGKAAGAAVLTHPAFARPAVLNVRKPGPKSGAVSLAQERRRRLAEAARQAELHRAPPHAVTAASAAAQALPGNARFAADVSAMARGLVAGSGICSQPAMLEAALIAAALTVLESRMRRSGATMEAPQHVRQFLALHMAEREREAFGVLFLTARHALIEFNVMFEGSLTQTSVYPREVVKRALALNAGAVILAHNHPSGEPEPSRDDELLTQALRQALALVDVRVIDHVIVGRLRAVSMAERGMI